MKKTGGRKFRDTFPLIMYMFIRQFIEYKKAALKYLYTLNDLLVINILLAYYIGILHKGKQILSVR